MIHSQLPSPAHRPDQLGTSAAQPAKCSINHHDSMCRRGGSFRVLSARPPGPPSASVAFVSGGRTARLRTFFWQNLASLSATRSHTSI